MKKDKIIKSSISSTPKPTSEKPNIYHTPVLLHESVAALNILPDGIYVDCTFGGGGHSGAILHHLGSGGKLFAFDQDEDAGLNVPADPRLVFLPHNFRHLTRILKLHDIRKVNGILADLGVSSHHFDSPERGFSTRFDAPLDMRMDKKQLLTAADVLNTYSDKELHRVFEEFGEVTNSKTLAKKITDLRKSASWNTTGAFKKSMHEMVKGNPNRYFAQVFQALRIEVNDELGALKDMLQQVADLLIPGGRIAVITFHSLEDRLVKKFFRAGSFEEKTENPFEKGDRKPVFRIITKKPVVAGNEEIKNNPRARSAKLRVAEKI